MGVGRDGGAEAFRGAVYGRQWPREDRAPGGPGELRRGRLLTPLTPLSLDRMIRILYRAFRVNSLTYQWSIWICSRYFLDRVSLESFLWGS